MSCADIKTDAKFALLKEDDVTWSCKPCRGLAVQAAQTDKLIEDRCSFYMAQAMQEIQSVKVELKGDIGSVNAKVTEATDEIRGIKTQLDKVTGELKADVLDLRAQGSKASGGETTALKKQVAELQSEMREMKQRDQRKQNLAVFNMPESEAEDAENRKSHDKEGFLQLCDEMDLQDIIVTGVTRLQASAQQGPAGTESVNHAPRPLRVRVESEAMRAKIVNNGKVLRMSRYSAGFFEARYDSARESGHALPQKDVDEQTGQSGQARQPASQPTGDVTEKATSVNSVISSLTCLYFNADSLLNKRNELRLVISQHQPMIICISEILPKNCVTPLSESELNIDNYKTSVSLILLRQGEVSVSIRTSN